jgi:hypothetical protein
MVNGSSKSVYYVSLWRPRNMYFVGIFLKEKILKVISDQLGFHSVECKCFGGGLSVRVNMDVGTLVASPSLTPNFMRFITPLPLILKGYLRIALKQAKSMTI